MVQVGNTVHPVSPFDPGGLDTVDSFLSLASAQGIKWEHDMRHLSKERKEMVAQIERFKHSPAILCEPLARAPLMALSRAAASWACCTCKHLSRSKSMFSSVDAGPRLEL